MKGMNFMDVVRVLDVHIERLRKEAQEQRGKLESQLIANKLRGLERSQQNRMKDLDMKQERERNDLHQQVSARSTGLYRPPCQPPPARQPRQCASPASPANAPPLQLVTSRPRHQFAMNERKTMEKHSRAYQTLLAETAGRATGGVILGDDSQQYLSRQNKSASYKVGLECVWRLGLGLGLGLSWGLGFVPDSSALADPSISTQPLTLPPRHASLTQTW